MQTQYKRPTSERVLDYYCKVLLCIVFLHRNGNFLDLVDSKVGGRAECSDDGLGVEPLLHVRLELLQELSRQEGDRGGAISNLRRFKNTNVNKRISQGNPDFVIISISTKVKGRLPRHPGSVQYPPGSWQQDEQRPAISGWWPHHWRLWPYLRGEESVVKWVLKEKDSATDNFSDPSYLCCQPSVCPFPWDPGWSGQPLQSPCKENTNTLSIIMEHIGVTYE